MIITQQVFIMIRWHNINYANNNNMKQITIQQVKQAIKIPAHKRKLKHRQILYCYLKSLEVFKSIPEQDIDSNKLFYLEILSYYLIHTHHVPQQQLTDKFQINSLIIVVRGSIKKIIYQKPVSYIDRVFEQKINYHRDKMYRKKQLAKYFNTKYEIVQQGGIYITQGYDIRILANQQLQIFYIQANKLKDAEILKQKSIKVETDFLKSTLFWNKFQIQQLRELVLKSSHIKYKKYQYVYKSNDPIQYVYLIRQGEFLYSKTLNLTNNNPKQIPLTKVFDGEIVGYNQLLSQKQSREYNLKCISITGQLYVFPLNYWYQLYAIFKQQFNQVKLKSENFKKEQIKIRVKSLESKIEYMHVSATARNNLSQKLLKKTKKKLKLTLEDYQENLKKEISLKTIQKQTPISSHRDFSSYDLKKNINKRINELFGDNSMYQNRIQKYLHKKKVRKLQLDNPFEIYKDTFKSILKGQKDKYVRQKKLQSYGYKSLV